MTAKRFNIEWDFLANLPLVIPELTLVVLDLQHILYHSFVNVTEDHTVHKFITECIASLFLTGRGMDKRQFQISICYAVIL